MERSYPPATAPSRRESTRPLAVMLLSVILLVFPVTAWAGSHGGAAVPIRAVTVNTVQPEMPDCHGGSWQSGNLTLEFSGCQATFFVMYALTDHFDQYFSLEQYNFSFAIPWVAEIAPNGSLVRLADPLDPISGTTVLTSGPAGVNVTLIEAVNVTSAFGNWTPDATWAGNGTGWSVGESPLGSVNVSIVFHLTNLSGGSVNNLTRNDSYGLKFDLVVDGWPWASPSDQLGFGTDSLAAWGAHFALNQTTSALEQAWNSSGKAYASLLFGPNATASDPATVPWPVTVTQRVGFFFAGSPDRRAVDLVTFSSPEGNYSHLSYDPWVVFTPLPASPATASPPLGDFLVPAVAAVALASAAVVASVVVLRRNRVRLRAEGEELVAGMRRRVAEDETRPDRPR